MNTKKIKKKLIDNLKTIVGGLLGGVAFWLSMYWFFHFETWAERIGSITATITFVYIIAKFGDKIFPDE